MNKLTQNMLYSATLLGIMELFKFIKLSYIFGSYLSFFSINNIFYPMVGILSSTILGASFFVFKAIFKLIVVGGNPLVMLALQLPFIFAALAWKNFKVMTFVSILSMVLFIAHPVGSAAWLYAMLWLIPFVISIINSNNIFLKSLGSTFTAHAVGAVAWLYLVGNLSAQAWLALIPLVIVERAVFASGMTLVYFVYKNLVRLPRIKKAQAQTL